MTATCYGPGSRPGRVPTPVRLQSGYGHDMATTLVRPRSGKRLAGVCAALADRFGLSRALVRVGFVVFGLVGVGELVYIGLWIVIPKAPY